MIQIAQPTPASAATELPPVHPHCKVISVTKLQSRAKEMRKRGDWLEANLLMDALSAALHGTTHQP